MPGLTEALFIPYRPVCNTHAYCVQMLNTSVQVRGTCSCFLTKPVCKMRSFHHLAQPPSWRTTSCRLSATVYLIYSQISSILEAVPSSANWGRVTSLWQGPTNHLLKDPGVDWRIILRWICRKWDMRAWTGSMWFRIGTGGGHLWMRQWTFGFHTMWGISWLAENRLATQEGLCSIE